ncbi:MAG: hypothetical protein QXH27_00745 [Candidatus Micrarchaeia archaeon]
MWGVTRELLAENKLFFLRLVLSVTLCTGGVLVLIASWYASSQIANAYPTEPISALPIPQLVYNAALPAGSGLGLFLLGLIARFATRGSLPWLVMAALVWALSGYNLYSIGLYRPQAPFSEYLSQTVTFLLLGLVLFGVAVLVSWHGEVVALVARHRAREKEAPRRKEEKPKASERTPAHARSEEENE